MTYLHPIYNNDIGRSYILKNKSDKPSHLEKIQIQLAEIAFTLSKTELKVLLSVITSAKNPCKCPDCSKKSNLKIIKCKTEYADVILKTSPKNISTLEELIKHTLFELEIGSILKSNQIS